MWVLGGGSGTAVCFQSLSRFRTRPAESSRSGPPGSAPFCRLFSLFLVGIPLGICPLFQVSGPELACWPVRGWCARRSRAQGCPGPPGALGTLGASQMPTMASCDTPGALRPWGPRNSAHISAHFKVGRNVGRVLERIMSILCMDMALEGGGCSAGKSAAYFYYKKSISYRLRIRGMAKV